MKYIILLGDGMGDYKLGGLGGKTPLEAARTPAMDYAASKGEIGTTLTIPQGFPKGSDVANLGIFGYDPAKYYTGRSPLEALSLKIDLSAEEVAFRCNLVNLAQKDGRLIMNDFSAGHITTQEAAKIIDTLNEHLSDESVRFFHGISYRHIMVKKRGATGLGLTPPHDITDMEIQPYMPDSTRAKDILQLMQRSVDILKDHDVNVKRVSENKLPANSIWLWGEGHAPKLPSYKEKYNLTGAVISAVDLIKGIGIAAGLTPVEVPGATGYIDTDYEAKARYALSELEEKDFVYLHVEAPDEAAHQGHTGLKVKAIEDFDEKVVKAIFDGMRKFKDYKIIILCDHFTPISLKTHTDDKVPVIIYDSRNENNFDRAYDEKNAAKGELRIDNAYDIMDYVVINDE